MNQNIIQVFIQLNMKQEPYANTGFLKTGLFSLWFHSHLW